MAELLQGSIARKSSADRKEIFRRAIEELFLPQRRLLLEFRDHTRQSALVEDGPFSEMLASIVTGVPGRSRRGIGPANAKGDLSDGTEVKRAYRIDPNIDFVLRGRIEVRGSSRRLIVDRAPAELLEAQIRGQANKNASSIQLLREERHLLYPVPECMSRTKAKDAVEVAGSGLKIKFGQGKDDWVHDGLSGDFVIRQERQHVNFGRKTKSQLRSILKRRPLLVFYGYDLLGRVQIAVIRCVLEEKDLTRYLKQIYSGRPSGAKAQAQPYLFADNRRGSLVSEGVHSVAALGGRLLAAGVESPEGFEVTYWDPAGSRTVADPDVADALTTGHTKGRAIPLIGPRDAISLESEEGRQAAARRFFDEGIRGWISQLEPYCELTGTTRNIGLANRSQHLVSCVTGLLGTRSSARGADLLESDGSPSDVKLSTGEPGDAFKTVGNPPLTLGENPKKLKSWRRLFAVRIVDAGDGEGPRVLVHAPDADTMASFHEQIDSFFRGRRKNGGGGLQYAPGKPFPVDFYGYKRRLDFIRVADLQGTRRKLFPNSVPEI